MRSIAAILVSFFASVVVMTAQQPADPAAREALAALTAADHQQMMAQLGIRKLRPGPSGNESAPNHANYDEATANPYPNLPDLLTLKNGTKVTTRTSGGPSGARRSSRTSSARSSAACRERADDHLEHDRHGTVVRRRAPGYRPALVGHVDNSASPAITVDIQMTLVTAGSGEAARCR